MEIGCAANRRLGLVWDQKLAVGLGQVCDANAFRKTGTLHKVGLKNINLGFLDEITELPTRVFVLACRHGHIQSRANLCIAGVVVLRDRFLVMNDVQLVLKAPT